MKRRHVRGRVWLRGRQSWLCVLRLGGVGAGGDWGLLRKLRIR